MMLNPFDVQTPENLSADEMSDLFVHKNTDFFQLEKAGHTFISGPRGAGKSMFFRFLEPDCQVNYHGDPVSKLRYYSVYVPIKETDLNLPELLRLQGTKHAAIVLNEHALVVHAVTKLFVSLKEKISLPKNGAEFLEEFRKFETETLVRLLNRSGWTETEQFEQATATLTDSLGRIIRVFESIYSQYNQYARNLAFHQGIQPYNGVLLGYSDFLAPLVESLLKLSFMPNGPIFLLIDDADNLNRTQTEILNSWVARRTTGYLCLKISTQDGEYKTFLTTGGQRIDAPHDYSDFNISDRYTTQRDNYLERVRDIVERRLQKAGIDVEPEDFFPENKKQEEAIDEIARQLIADWETSGKGYRPNDDAIRYARPNYMRDLSAGGRKSGSAYSYAGFKQIVHLSSGIVRHMLEASSLMFGEAAARASGAAVGFIPVSIQNEALKEYSDRMLFKEFDELRREEGDQGIDLDDPGKLKNLIDALGGMFRAILISDASERRVFSIAFSDRPDEEVSRVLRLGVKYGYFHKSTIGNKEGTGRVPLYILTRRLAPSYKLDPTSFAGYKFVTNEKIREAMLRPKRLIELVKISGFEQVMEPTPQGTLFDDA